MFTVESVAVAELRAHPRNYRGHPERQLDEIADSIERHGLYRNIVVSRDRTILAGHGVVAAARRLGHETVPVHVLDVDADDPEAIRVLIGDNELARLAEDDERLLAELLVELQTVDDLDATGFDDAALDELLASLDVEPTDIEAEPATDSFAIYDRDEIERAVFGDYRTSGFPYPRRLPRHRALIEINALAALSGDELATSRLGYAVADGYHPHRYDVQVLSQPSPIAAFNDDRRLRLCIARMIDDGSSFGEASFRANISLTRGAQGASNFRPGYALLMLRRYGRDATTVLDCSTGFGGRLVGFLASHLTRYVGIDPATLTDAGNRALVAELCPPSKTVELHHAAAEDVDPAALPRCDLAFTSPPYFVKEHYTDEDTQSWVRYPTINEWRRGFLEPLLRLQHAVLDDGAHNVINIADVTVNSREHALVEMTCDVAQSVGFELIKLDELRLTSRFGAHLSEEVHTEPVIVLRK